MLARKAAEEFQAELSGDDEAKARVVLAASFLSQDQPEKAQEVIGRALELARKSQNRSVRLLGDITSDRIRASLGKPAEAKKRLKATLEAKKYGFIGSEFEARLALAAAR